MAKTFVLPNGKTVTKPFNPVWIALAIVVVLVIVFWQFITFNPEDIKPRELTVLLVKLFTPQGSRDWGDYFAYFPRMENVLVDTIQMCFGGTFLGAALAIPVAVLAARNLAKTRWIYGPMRFLMNLFRTIPVLVLALLSGALVGGGVLAGILAITLFTFGIMAKMLYEVIETIDMNSVEALESTGANRVQSFRFAVVPQIFPVFLGYVIYIFEINIRASSILGYVGAGGIGSIISDNAVYYYDRVGAAIILILVVTLIVQFFANAIRRKLQ